MVVATTETHEIKEIKRHVEEVLGMENSELIRLFLCGSVESPIRIGYDYWNGDTRDGVQFSIKEPDAKRNTYFLLKNHLGIPHQCVYFAIEIYPHSPVRIRCEYIPDVKGGN